MNCREAQDQVFAERDSALDNTQRAALEAHVTHCATCRRIRDELSAALTMWRVDAEKATVPDVDREWYAVRRQIRGGVEAGAEGSWRPRRNFVPWLAVPLGAAAAVAVALFVSSPTPSKISPVPGAQTARANAVVAPGNSASTMVFVDDKSGWLFVWASDATPTGG